MNKKIRNIVNLIEQMNIIDESPSTNEGMSDVLNYTGAKLQRIEDEIKAKKKKIEDAKYQLKRKIDNAKIGNYNVGSKINAGIKGAKVAGKVGVGATKAGVNLAGGSIGDLLLAGLGLPNGTARRITDAINKGIDLATAGKKQLTPEQEKKEAERQLDIIRRNEGKMYWVVYTIVKPDSIPKTNVWKADKKLLNKADAIKVFKDYQDNLIATKDEYMGATYEVDEVSETPVSLNYPMYQITVEVKYQDGTTDTLKLEPIHSKDKATAEKYVDVLWKRKVKNSSDPDKYHKARYDIQSTAKI